MSNLPIPNIPCQYIPFLFLFKPEHIATFMKSFINHYNPFDHFSFSYTFARKKGRKNETSSNPGRSVSLFFVLLLEWVVLER